MTDELLTPEERRKAWDDTFEEAVYLDHKPTGEEIFDLRLESVAKAQLAKPVTKVCPECKGEREIEIPDYFGEVYPRDCPACSGTGKITKTIKEIVEEWKK